ncbi:MAG: GNAT family N-acetyltransferase [Candidatus Thorarchaeota archaeon]|nr:GNAT family N-acetyltransferase [Candidatus Thorarchaeota archaeon]
MVDQLVVRPPEASERDEFFQVYCTGLPGVDEVSHDRFSKWWEEAIASGNMERLWRVMVIKQEIVAVVINVVNQSLNWGLIWELAVVPELRSRGIGRRLVAESERLLLKDTPRITHLALGVKTHNTRAAKLYEELGYGVRSLVINLRGRSWKPHERRVVDIRPANRAQIDGLARLQPDAYWNHRSIEMWSKAIRDESIMVVGENQEVIGFASFILSSDETTTEIQFHILSGREELVLDAFADQIKTENMEFWVQDNHQGVLDYLYHRGFRRVDSEYLMMKRARTSQGCGSVK